MFEYLKKITYAAAGAILYSVMSLSLNLIYWSMTSLIAIGYLTKEGFSWPYDALKRIQPGLGFILGLFGALGGITVGALLAVVSLPFVTLFAIYDLLYDMVVGAMHGFEGGMSKVLQNLGENWEYLHQSQLSSRVGYSLTTYHSFMKWLDDDTTNQNPTVRERTLGLERTQQTDLSTFTRERIQEETLEDLYNVMTSPNNFYEVVRSSVRQTIPTSIQAEQNRIANHLFVMSYINAYMQGRYYLVDVLLSQFHFYQFRILVMQTLFDKCIEEHLLRNEAPLAHFLNDFPDFRDRATSLIEVREKQCNAYEKLQTIPCFPNKQLSEDELTKARSINNEQMKLLMTQYDQLMEKLTSDEDQLFVQMEFEPDDDIYLFVKQYQTPSGEWESVPLNTYKTSTSHLKGWFGINAGHPVLRENILSPPKYKEQTTRYVIHRYDNPKQDGCQLLNQLADGIRNVAKKAAEKQLDQTNMADFESYQRDTLMI